MKDPAKVNSEFAKSYINRNQVSFTIVYTRTRTSHKSGFLIYVCALGKFQFNQRKKQPKKSWEELDREKSVTDRDRQKGVIEGSERVT